MKNSLFTHAKLCFILVLFISCSDDEGDDQATVSTVYNEESFVEISSLNGSDVSTTSFTDGVTSGTNTIDVAAFGSTNLTGFNTGIGVPTDDSVSINASLDDADIILTNGTEVPPFFAGGNTGIVFDAGDGVLRLEIRYNFTYPSNANPIPINTINRIRLVYSIEYSSAGNVIHTTTFTHTVFFE